MQIQADPQKVIKKLSELVGDLQARVAFLESFIEDNVNTATEAPSSPPPTNASSMGAPQGFRNN